MGLSVSINQKKCFLIFSYQFEKRLQNMIAMLTRKGLYTSRRSWSIKTYFWSLKPDLAFQTFTHQRLTNVPQLTRGIFFLGKNCFWTWVPGSIWLKTPITWFRNISSLRNFDDLQVHQGVMMPPSHQAGIQGTLKQCLNISWQSAKGLIHHIFFCSMVFPLQ